MRIPRISPAMAVALLALVLSTTGTTIAATTLLPRDSVGASQLRAGAVTSAEIRNRSITMPDLAFATIGSLRRPSGTAGGDLGGTYPNPTIGTGVVTATALADGAVGTSKLVDGSVVGAKIADGTIAGTKLADASIAGSKLTDGSIGGSKIMSGSIESSDLVANEAWQAPSLGPGWGTSSLAGYQEASFRKDRFGEVHLRGEAWKSADDAGSVIFTLPVGYRPLKQRKFSIPSHDNVGTTRAGVAIVFANGDVLIYGTTDDRNISLEGIEFVAGE